MAATPDPSAPFPDRTRIAPPADPGGDPAGSELPGRLAGELRAVMLQLRRRMRAQVGNDDLTPSQIAAILRLDRDGPLTLSALGRAEGVRPQSMAAIVAALQAMAFVSGAADPADRRQTLLSLSATGRDWLAATRAARQDWLTRRIARELSGAEQEQLAIALGLLRRIGDD